MTVFNIVYIYKMKKKNYANLKYTICKPLLPVNDWQAKYLQGVAGLKGNFVIEHIGSREKMLTKLPEK